MAHASEPRLLVLQGLRLKGFGEPPAIATAVGLGVPAVEEQLDKLQAEDLVLRRDGRLSGWALTREGRAEQERVVTEQLAELGLVADVRAAYERFLALNHGMLGICTDWQVRNEAPNDHSDAAYDGAVIGRLREVHDGVLPIVADLAELLLRFGGYEPRFTAALGRLDAGELEYFTKPIIDSYHTIWFELHEDLLTSLGIERSQEGST